MRRIKAYLRRLIVRVIIEDIRNGGELRRVIKGLSDEPYRPFDRLSTITVTSNCDLPAAMGNQIVRGHR